MKHNVKVGTANKKLTFLVHVLQTRQILAIIRIVVLQRTAKKCTKNYNARAQPLF